MAQKTVEVIIKAKDETSGVINKIESGFGNLTGAISVAQVAYYKLAQAVGEHIQEAVNGAIEQDKANQQLITSLRQEGLYTESNLKSLLNLADVRQKITRFTDEETISAQAYLVTIGLSINQVKQYTPLIQDMAEKVALVTGEQANLGAMAKLVGMAMDDNFGRMKMAGIVLTENEEKTIKYAQGNEKLAKIYEILSSRVKDTATEMGKSLAGQMKINLQMIDEEYEKLGKQLIPIYMAWKQTLLFLTKAFNETWKVINTFYDLSIAGSLEVARGFLNLSRIGIEGFKALRDFLFDLGIDKIFNIMMDNVMNILSNVINYIKGFVEKVNIGGIADNIIKKLDVAVTYAKNLSTGFKKAGEDLEETKKISDKGFKSILSGLENSIKFTKKWRDAYVETASDIWTVTEEMNNNIKESNQEMEESNTETTSVESKNRIDYRQLELYNAKINYLTDKTEFEENEETKTELEKYYANQRMQEVKNKIVEMQAAAKKREEEEKEHIKRMNEINASYFSTFKTEFKNELNNLYKAYNNHTTQMKNLAHGTASALNNSFQTLFFNIFHGNLKNGLKQFGDTFLKGMENALIQFLATATMGKFLTFIGLGNLVVGAPKGSSNNSGISSIAGIGAIAGAGSAAGAGAAAGSTGASIGGGVGIGTATGVAGAATGVGILGAMGIAGAFLGGASLLYGAINKQHKLTPEEIIKNKKVNEKRLSELEEQLKFAKIKLENEIKMNIARGVHEGNLKALSHVTLSEISDIERNIFFAKSTLRQYAKLGYQSGGIIPGLPSESKLILAHGREKIIPYGSPDYNQSNNTSNNIININFESVSIRDERDIRSLADMIMEKIDRKNDLLTFGIA